MMQKNDNRRSDINKASKTPISPKKAKIILGFNDSFRDEETAICMRSLASKLLSLLGVSMTPLGMRKQR